MKKRLNEILVQIKRPIIIQDDVEYKQVKMGWWNKGLSLRKIEVGSNIKTKKQFIVESGDFIICTMNAKNGAIGFAGEELNGAAVKSNFPTFTFDDTHVDKNWFKYFISTKYFNQICVSSTSGTAQGSLRTKELLEHEIHLPPLEEQIRIAKRLEEAEQQSLSIQSESDRLLQDISDFRQEILTRAFRGDLTEQNFDEGTGMELLTSIQLERQTQQTKGKKKTELAPVSKEEEPYELPPNWTWTRLGEVAITISKGTTPPKVNGENYTVSGVNFLRVENINKKLGLNLENVNYVSETIHNSVLSRSRGEEGDILFSIAGALGRIAVLKKEHLPCNMNQAISFIRTYKNFICVDFVKLALSSPFIQSEIMKNQKATAQANLSIENLKNALIPLPPLSEQHRIVAKIESIFSALDVMEDAITKQKDEAKACYEEILRKEMGTSDKES